MKTSLNLHTALAILSVREVVRTYATKLSSYAFTYVHARPNERLINIDKESIYFPYISDKIFHICAYKQ